MEIFKSKFQAIFFDKENNVEKQVWQDTTDMTEEDFKREVMENAGCLEKFGAANHLSDIRKYNFAVVPELQTWTAENFFPKLINAGVKKYALIMNTVVMSISADHVSESVISTRS